MVLILLKPRPQKISKSMVFYTTTQPQKLPVLRDGTCHRMKNGKFWSSFIKSLLAISVVMMLLNWANIAMRDIYPDKPISPTTNEMIKTNDF